jgi:ATP diphosphatase
MSKDARKSLPDLLAVMAALRTPGTGCPWDLEQNFRTIAPYTVEEAYEVADAIEKGDRGALKEELGDLLLQVVYHARMAEEEGAFAFADVVDAIAAKMIRRHPHVFGSEAERAAGAAPGFWERIKAEERAAQPRQASPPPPGGEGLGVAGASKAPTGILADVPVGLPALTRAVKLQDKAAKVGFDWPSLAPVFDKLKEEFGELEAAMASSADRTKIGEEFGDLLFVVANVARHL